MNLPEIWLGSEQAHHRFLESYSHFQENQDKYSTQIEFLQRKLEGAGLPEKDREPMSLAEYMAQDMIMYHNNIGILSISGPMTREVSFWSAISGGTGYDAIGEGLSMLAEDEDCEAILLAFDTPGGDANGVYELSEVIQQVSQSKPVFSWASGGALSAGYWLATSAQEFYTSRMAEIGSIGAISTFTSIARMMKDQGIDVHVARSGKYKALLNPMEPISEAGKKNLQQKTEYLHNVFVDAVIQNRPALAQKERSSWAEGQTFFADQAIEEGLVSGPAISLSEILGKLETRFEGGTMKRQQIILSESARAALLSGAKIETLDHKVSNTDEVDSEPDFYSELNDSEGYKPTSEMAAEAKRGLEWREEYGRGGTEVGVARARDISNRKNLSADTVKRMVSYFARHEVDKKAEGWSPGEDGYPSAGRIAWALWSGDAGKSWANKIANQLEKEEESDASETSVLPHLMVEQNSETKQLEKILEDKDNELESLRLSVSLVNKDVEDLSISNNALRNIVSLSCENLSKACNEELKDIVNMSDQDLIYYYGALNTKIKKVLEYKSEEDDQKSVNLRRIESIHRSAANPKGCTTL